MTTPCATLTDFLRGLIRDEEAAQRYLLDPEAALGEAGWTRITMAEVFTAADDLGLRGCSETSDPTEAIRQLLQLVYLDGTAHRNILSVADASRLFDYPAAPG